MTKNLNINTILTLYKGDINMVKAIITIDDRTNRVLNIVKAKYGLKDKSEAINMMALQYESILEPELRPEYVTKIKRISKQKGTKYNGLDDLRRKIENA